MTHALVDKIHRLLEQHRVFLVAGSAEAIVLGDTAAHTVHADPGGITCSCLAAAGGHWCSHAAAAMVAWKEAA